jgi:hypothetical protein
VPALTTPEPSFEETARIQQFWDKNYARLLADYPELYVAVNRRTGEVEASNPDLERLVYDLRDRAVDIRRDVAIRFVSALSRSLIL